MKEIMEWMAYIATVSACISLIKDILLFSKRTIKAFSADKLKMQIKNDRLNTILTSIIRLIPLFISGSVLAFDLYSNNPIDKILIMRLSLNVCIVFSTILWLFIFWEIEKIKRQTLGVAAAFGSGNFGMGPTPHST